MHSYTRFAVLRSIVASERALQTFSTRPEKERKNGITTITYAHAQCWLCGRNGRTLHTHIHTVHKWRAFQLRSVREKKTPDEFICIQCCACDKVALRPSVCVCFCVCCMHLHRLVGRINVYLRICFSFRTARTNGLSFYILQYICIGLIVHSPQNAQSNNEQRALHCCALVLIKTL